MNDATTTNANQMETITLIELLQPQLLAEAEAAVLIPISLQSYWPELSFDDLI